MIRVGRQKSFDITELEAWYDYLPSRRNVVCSSRYWCHPPPSISPSNGRSD